MLIVELKFKGGSGKESVRGRGDSGEKERLHALRAFANLVGLKRNLFGI